MVSLLVASCLLAQPRLVRAWSVRLNAQDVVASRLPDIAVVTHTGGISRLDLRTGSASYLVEGRDLVHLRYKTNLLPSRRFAGRGWEFEPTSARSDPPLWRGRVGALWIELTPSATWLVYEPASGSAPERRMKLHVGPLASLLGDPDTGAFAITSYSETMARNEPHAQVFLRGVKPSPLRMSEVHDARGTDILGRDHSDRKGICLADAKSGKLLWVQPRVRSGRFLGNYILGAYEGNISKPGPTVLLDDKTGRIVNARLNLGIKQDHLWIVGRTLVLSGRSGGARQLVGYQIRP